MMTAPNPADDFDVAKKVLDELKGLSPERQERVLRWVMEGLGLRSVVNTAASSTEVPALPIVATSSRQLAGSDIKSFVASKAPKSDNQFAAVVAYYYRFEAPPAQRRDSIDPEVLQEATRLAGRSRLGNPRATLNNAKGMGYLDSNSPGQFSINNVGENLVAMTLPSDGAVAAPRKKKAAKAAGKRKTRS
jgi:hypothetical protein